MPLPLDDLRDPVSTWTHLLGLAAALPTTWLLIRKAWRTPADPDDPASAAFRAGKVASLGVFGIGMAACYAASAAYHGYPADEEGLAFLRRLDLVGIFLLIAGTFTPAAWALMHPGPRRAAMLAVWGVSGACAWAVLAGRPFPTWLATSIYLGLGWGMALCYADIRRRHDRRTLRLLPVGGLLYSLGAAVNLSPMPDLAPGVGPHEVFHVFVLAGTAAHVAFLLRVVVPARPPWALPTRVESDRARERRRAPARVEA